MEIDKFTRRVIAIGALMAGVGVFYHYVIFIPGVERAKQEQLGNEKKEAELKNAEKARQYKFCKDSSLKVYDLNWAGACKAVAEDRKLQYENCLNDPLVMSNQFMGKQHCRKTYEKTDPSPECTLPSGRANRIKNDLKEAQEKCLEESKSAF